MACEWCLRLRGKWKLQRKMLVALHNALHQISQIPTMQRYYQGSFTPIAPDAQRRAQPIPEFRPQSAHQQPTQAQASFSQPFLPPRDGLTLEQVRCLPQQPAQASSLFSHSSSLQVAFVQPQPSHSQTWFSHSQPMLPMSPISTEAHASSTHSSLQQLHDEAETASMLPIYSGRARGGAGGTGMGGRRGGGTERGAGKYGGYGRRRGRGW